MVIVENLGGRPLSLQQPTATCGCQQPLLKARYLRPGERTELVLRQKAGETQGPFQHLVSIKSDDPATPETTIYLFGVVTRGLVVRPEPLVFEDVKLGETKLRHLEVFSDDGVPFRLTHQVASGPLGVRALLDKPGTLHRVEVTLRGPRTLGPLSERIILNTDKPDSLPLTITVTGEVVGPVSVAPTAMTLGTVHGYQEVTRNILVKGGDARSAWRASMSRHQAGGPDIVSFPDHHPGSCRSWS